MLSWCKTFPFLSSLLAVWCALALLFLANFIFLERSNEQTDPRTVALKQQQVGGLYQSAFYENTEAYKLALYDVVRPDIAIVGSSRVLQFRPYAITTSFLTTGAPTTGMAQIHERISKMLAIHSPKLLLLGLDFWWFNPRRKLPSLANWRQGYVSTRGDFNPRTRDLALPLLAVLDGRLKIRDYFQILFKPTKQDTFGPRFGLAANLKNRGFFRDGSYLYDLAMLVGTSPEGKAALTDHLERIKKGTKGFEHAMSVDEIQFSLLLRTLALLKTAGVATVVFLPPLAPPMIEEQTKNSENFAYIDALQRRIAALEFSFFNFHDPGTIDSGICEFLDGMHAGDIASLRMLRKIATSSPSPLSNFFDSETAEKIIKRFNGRAALVLDRAGYVEADFLERDCEKRRAN
jgi:hypothetical protein